MLQEVVMNQKVAFGLKGIKDPPKIYEVSYSDDSAIESSSPDQNPK
jgi:hypothetical protein